GHLMLLLPKTSKRTAVVISCSLAPGPSIPSNFCNKNGSTAVTSSTWVPNETQLLVSMTMTQLMVNSLFLLNPPVNASTGSPALPGWPAESTYLCRPLPRCVGSGRQAGPLEQKYGCHDSAADTRASVDNVQHQHNGGIQRI